MEDKTVSLFCPFRKFFPLANCTLPKQKLWVIEKNYIGKLESTQDKPHGEVRMTPTAVANVLPSNIQTGQAIGESGQFLLQ